MCKQWIARCQQIFGLKEGLFQTCLICLRITDSVPIHPRWHSPTEINMENILVVVVLVIILVRIFIYVLSFFVLGVRSFKNMCWCCCLFQWRRSGNWRCSALGDIVYKHRSWPKYNVYIKYKPFVRKNDSSHELCPFQRSTFTLYSVPCTYYQIYQTAMPSTTSGKNMIWEE